MSNSSSWRQKCGYYFLLSFYEYYLRHEAEAGTGAETETEAGTEAETVAVAIESKIDGISQIHFRCFLIENTWIWYWTHRVEPQSS